jgi:hypothetical protein
LTWGPSVKLSAGRRDGAVDPTLKGPEVEVAIKTAKVGHATPKPPPLPFINHDEDVFVN